MCAKLVHITLLLALTAYCAAAQYSRDESREDAKTTFNLASTLTGGIESSRHRQHANVNAGLYTPTAERQRANCATCSPTTQYASVANAPADIDEPHGHERSESDAAVGHRVGQAPRPSVAFSGGSPFQQPSSQQPGNSAGVSPSQQPGAYSGIPPYQQPPPRGIYFGPGVYPAMPLVHQPTESRPYPGIPPGQPGQPGQPQPLPVVLPGQPLPAYANPQFAQYPGQYLPQYPVLTQPAQFPINVGYGPTQPGGIPVAAHPAPPPTSYQNYHRYPQHNPYDGDHWDHRFKMQTEYKEDGVHKGPFGTLNNHSPYGYGSGFGGGYNGAFNRPGY